MTLLPRVCAFLANLVQRQHYMDLVAHQIKSVFFSVDQHSIIIDKTASPCSETFNFSTFLYYMQLNLALSRKLKPKKKRSAKPTLSVDT